MDKELIELLKYATGNAETLIIWYMALHFVGNIISWIGAGFCLYMVGKGFRYVVDNH